MVTPDGGTRTGRATGAAARMLVAHEMRARARTLAAVAVVALLATGAALTCAAGARRADRAPDRYIAAAHLPDLLAFGLPTSLSAADLAALGGVTRVATYSLVASQPQGADPSAFFPMAAPEDPGSVGAFLTEPVQRGRRPDPRRPDEVALGETTARRLGVDVGDVLRLDTYTADQAGALESGSGTRPGGPVVALRVVGVVRQPGDLGGREGDVTVTALTPAFWAEYRERVGTLDRLAMVRLAPGTTPDAFAGELAGLAPDAGVDTQINEAGVRAALAPSAGVVRSGLWALAAAMALTGAVAVGLGLARAAHAAAADDAALRSMGVGRRQRVARIAVPGALFAAAGAALGAAASVAASPTMPIGLPRRADPSPGFAFDGAVLVAGLAAAVLLAAALAVLVGYQATRRQRPAAVRPSALEAGLTRLPTPPSVSTGLLLARRHGGRQAAPARAAASAAVGGVVGVLGAVIFAASASHLLASPRLYGWGWDAVISGAETDDIDTAVVDTDRLQADGDVAAAAVVSTRVPMTADGHVVDGTVVRPLKGDTTLVLLAGRQARGPDEAVLGSSTMRALGAAVGRTVRLEHGEAAGRFRVVGEAVFPVPPDGGSSADGVAVTGDGADRLGLHECGDVDECVDNVALTLRASSALPRVSARYADPEHTIKVRPPAPPAQAVRLRQVDRVPWLLAGFLAALAVLTLAHAIGTAVRRRRHELAVLRCLGFTGHQLRAVVSTQAVALVAGSCSVGVLLGVVAGRVVWRAVTTAIDLPPSPTVPLAAVAAVPLTVLALAQLASIPPRRAAARLSPAEVLRRD